MWPDNIKNDWYDDIGYIYDIQYAQCPKDSVDQDYIDSLPSNIEAKKKCDEFG